MTLAARTRPMEVLEVANACLKSPGNALLGWPWVLAALAQAEEAARSSSSGHGGGARARRGASRGAVRLPRIAAPVP